MNRLFSIVTVLLVILLSNNFLFACFSWGNSNPACYEFYKADAVFIGIIKAIEEKTLKVDFSVEEVISGNFSKEITIFDTHTCGYGKFEVGKKYLVYAKKDPWTKDKVLSVRGTSKVEEFPRAETYVEELRNFLKADDASIYGKIYTFNRGALRKIKIKVTGEGQTFETYTDFNGKFRIENLALGNYSVTVGLPSNFRWQSGEKPKKELSFQLLKGECAKVDFVGEIKSNLWF